MYILFSVGYRQRLHTTIAKVRHRKRLDKRARINYGSGGGNHPADPAFYDGELMRWRVDTDPQPPELVLLPGRLTQIDLSLVLTWWTFIVLVFTSVAKTRRGRPKKSDKNPSQEKQQGNSYNNNNNINGTDQASFKSALLLKLMSWTHTKKPAS